MKKKRPYWWGALLLASFVSAVALSWRSPRPLSVSSPLRDVSSRKEGSQSALTSQIQAAYRRLPLHFEANCGQTDKRVKFLSRGSGYTLFLTSHEAVLSLLLPQGAQEKRTRTLSPSSPFSAVSSSGPRFKIQSPGSRVLSIKLVGSNPNPRVAGREQLPGKANYFVGNDPKKWRTNVPTYAEVRHEAVYPGVDLVYHGNQQQLEYDFIVAPYADPESIRLGFEGADKVEIDDRGDLVLQTAGGQIRQLRPFVYQEVNGLRKEISGDYVPKGKHEVGFELGAYDPARPLVIDPVLLYSTYLGAGGEDSGNGIAVDSSGNAYVTGDTSSINFATAGSLQSAYGGGSADAFVVKLNAAGNALVYSTYLGGGGTDQGNGIAVDSSGNAYVTGLTSSINFPTVNALQSVYGGGTGGFDAFVAKLNASGSALLYSTYLGGNVTDLGFRIAVDSSGNAYVAGRTDSTNFPTANALQPTKAAGEDAFVAKLNATGSALVYSTHLGGNNNDSGRAIAVDSSGSAYVTGATGSTNFPTVNPLRPAHAGGGIDAFVAKLNSTGSALVYSTYLGGSGQEEGHAIAADASGNATVTGNTNSTNFPTANALQPALAGPPSPFGNGDAFVAKLNATGTAFVYSTYLGGSSDEVGFGIAIDTSGNAYVAGQTFSTNFPTANPSQQALAGPADAFVAKLNPAGSALLYSTYLGGGDEELGLGIAVDSSGNAYVTGQTLSTNFPTANPLQSALGGSLDAFVTKLIEVLTVAIDIKPGSFPNSINLGSSGNVPVAIFSTATFDARTVSPTTVTLAGAAVRLRGQGTPMASFEDVNRDGLLDLVVQVTTEALQLSDTDTQAVLEGQTFDGTRIRGVDTVRVIP